MEEKERRFTPFDPNTGERFEMRLSDADWQRHDHSHFGHYIVTDTETNERYLCRKEDCGLGCRCDASAQLLITMRKSRDLELPTDSSGQPGSDS